MTRISNEPNGVPSEKPFETKFNQAVVWTASHTFRQVEQLKLGTSDSLTAKIGKVFAGLLSAIVLVPCALIAALSFGISDFLFGSIREVPQENISSCCSHRKSL